MDKDFLWHSFPPSKNRTYYGISDNIGIGTPGAELHIVWGETRSLNKKYNVFDIAESVYIKIMEGDNYEKGDYQTD